MTGTGSHRGQSLYERIEADIAVLEARRMGKDFLEMQLASPIFQVASSDRAGMSWRPKALSAGVFAESVIDDPLLRVLSARRTAPRTLQLRFLLKSDDIGPVRCVVILNGKHSVRISIKNGKIGRHRTTAELTLDIDPVAADTGDLLFVEVVRDMRLLFIGQLPARPTSLAGWAARAWQAALRALRAPWMSISGRRPVRVTATRLLEESFRIKAR